MKNVLVLAALEQEEQALIQKLKDEAGSKMIKKSVLNSKLGLEMSTASVGSRSISIVRTGIASVNSALALVLAQERTLVDSVILLGVGGALRPGLDVGDLVISTCILQHDYFYSFDHGDTRIRPGSLILSSKEAENHTAEFPADSVLVEWMKNAESSGSAVVGSINSASPHKVLTGAILSGNEFVGRVDRKRAVAALHPEALLVEMEAAGIAQISTRLGIPFVVAKTVADRMNPDGSIESDFRACLDAASEHAAAALHSLLMERG